MFTQRLIQSPTIRRDHHGRWLQAFQCFNAKWRHSVRPNVVTFTATIGACRRNWQLAGSIFATLLAEIQVNVIAFNTATGIMSSGVVLVACRFHPGFELPMADCYTRMSWLESLIISNIQLSM